MKKSNGLGSNGGRGGGFGETGGGSHGGFAGPPSTLGISSSYPGPSNSERSSYHNNSMQQERRCDSCGYRVAINECQQFKCKDCGTYIVG